MKYHFLGLIIWRSQVQALAGSHSGDQLGVYGAEGHRRDCEGLLQEADGRGSFKNDEQQPDAGGDSA